MAKEFTNLTCTHATLQAYMDRKYPYLNYKIKYFDGKLSIPMKGLKK
jgi:hypothetical protein